MTLSYKVFMSFVDENGDASRILSKDCYETWVATRRSKLKQPQESFRRVLTAHICGLDGRRPFPVEVETSLLETLRKREVWQCFRDTGVSIGIRGFRNVGYHERNGGNSRKRSLEDVEEKDEDEPEEKVKEVKSDRKITDSSESLPITGNINPLFPLVPQMQMPLYFPNGNANGLNMLQELQNMANAQALAGMMTMAQAPIVNNPCPTGGNDVFLNSSVNTEQKDSASEETQTSLEKLRTLTFESMKKANEAYLANNLITMPQDSPFQYFPPPTLTALPSPLLSGSFGRQHQTS